MWLSITRYSELAGGSDVAKWETKAAGDIFVPTRMMFTLVNRLKYWLLEPEPCSSQVVS